MKRTKLIAVLTASALIATGIAAPVNALADNAKATQNADQETTRSTNESEVASEPESEAENTPEANSDDSPQMQDRTTTPDSGDQHNDDSPAAQAATAEDAEAQANSGELTAVTLSAQTQSMAMHRLYNPYTGEHFYTSDDHERDELVKIGWRFENDAWKAPTSGKPVYRLYNPYVSGGDHHYTMDENEYTQLQKVGWRGEGVRWYSAGSDGVPLLREYNPYASTGTHHYTTNVTERANILAVGWRAEGVAWYGVADAAPSGLKAGQNIVNGATYYGNSDGSAARSSWKDGRWYGPDGKMAYSDLAWCNGAVYIFDANGNVKTGWQTVNGRQCYFDPDKGGTLAEGAGWKTVNGQECYLGAGGNRETGWLYLSDGTYYVTESGRVRGQQNIGGTTYQFNDQGRLLKGWQWYDGEWHDLGSNGNEITEHYHNLPWVGQPNNYYCGPSTGTMILRSLGYNVNVYQVASAMQTDAYHYTSFNDRKFQQGMNNWVGNVYTTAYLPSYSTVRSAVINSFRNGYATAVDEQERRGGPHFNGHNNGTYSHIMAIDGYNSSTDAVYIADPGGNGALWGGSGHFWYSSLKNFTENYLQVDVQARSDGKQHIGIYYAD